MMPRDYTFNFGNVCRHRFGCCRLYLIEPHFPVSQYLQSGPLCLLEIHTWTGSPCARGHAYLGWSAAYLRSTTTLENSI